MAVYLKGPGSVLIDLGVLGFEYRSKTIASVQQFR